LHASPHYHQTPVIRVLIQSHLVFERMISFLYQCVHLHKLIA
jgi:hypothetical protein